MAFFKTIWKNNTKHKKLSEELALQGIADADFEQHESENDVITFKLKYLGSTVVEKVSASKIGSSESVKNILKNCKSRKNHQRVTMAISLKGIIVTDLEGNDLLKVSIYRISNCSTDPDHKQVFSFLSTDSTETLECHAFICSKRKQAETVTLAIAHAFNTAYEAWRIMPNEENEIKNENSEENKTDKISVIEPQLIVFDDEQSFGRAKNFDEDTCNIFKNDWVCFDDDFTKQFYSRNVNNKSDLIMA